MVKMFDRILVLAPHTDDGEMGCGGSMSKFVEEGKNVHYVAFSGAEESVPEGMPKGILRTEALRATKELGLCQDQVTIQRFRVRYFSDSRQEILDEMIVLKQEINPDLVFLPSSCDTHQDHIVVTQEGIRCFKQCTMLGYELPWNNLLFQTGCFIKLYKRHLEKKINGISCYHSQKDRSYFKRTFWESLARVRGIQIQESLAEAFEVIRWVF